MSRADAPPPPTPRKIVIVVWKDIITRADWVGDRDAVINEMYPMPCVTVGWLLLDTEEFVIVVDSASKDRDYGGVSVIPKAVVVRIEELKKATPHSYLTGL